jgi:hypothetical protein
VFLIITFGYTISAKFLLIEFGGSDGHENIGVKNETSFKKLNETELKINQTKVYIGRYKLDA